MRHRSLRVVAGVAGVGLACLGAAQSAFYSYFKEQRPLELNPTVVAIYRDPQLGAPTLSGNASQESSLRAGPIAGWWYVDVPGGGTPERVAAMVGHTNGAVMPVFKDKFGGPFVFSSRLHVRFNGDVSADRAEAILRATGATSFRKNGFLSNFYVVELAERNGYEILDIANGLAARPEVRFATPNSTFSGKKNFTPNDPYYDRQWALGAGGAYPFGWSPRLTIRANQAWNVTVGQPSILTAVIDDGIQLNHPDINIANAKDFVPELDPQGNVIFGDGGPLTPFDIHGTIMAGIIAGKVNNGVGLAGTAGGSRVVSVRAHKSVGIDAFMTSPEILMNAFLWLHQAGCRITNNSNTYGGEDPLIEEAYLAAKGSSIVHFASAGNVGGTTLGYPANIEEAVNSVTGVLPNGALAPGATTGVGIDFSAPGAFTLTTDRTGPAGYPGNFPQTIFSSDSNYVIFDSAYNTTSFACAYVSGTAALVLSINPSLSPDQVSTIIAGTCLDLVEPPPTTPPLIGYDDKWGWGLVDAAKAVSVTLPATVSATPNPVKGGLQTQLRLNLALAAAATVQFPVTSDDISVIPVDSTPLITVNGGQTLGTLNLTTRGVDNARPVPVHVTMFNVRRTVVVNVIPASLNRFVLSKNTIFGGETVSGQIDLAGRAGPSGRTVQISDNSAVVNSPASVTVAAQANRAVFPIPTSRTTTQVNATVSATLDGFTLNQTLTLKPVFTDVQSLTLSPNTVMGGGRPIGTVRLTQPAPAGGAQIALTDSNTATSFVPNITIPAGGTEGTFTVYTGPVGTTTTATIAATYIGIAKTANLTITPTLWVTNLTVTPSMVRGGFGAVGRIQIYSNAPSGGVPVSVTDTNSYVSTPLTVVVPAGRNWVEFPITTYVTNTTVTGDVRASYGGVTKIAPITVYK